MRQTSAEIDHAILDVAAGIFATHGYAHSSVQQIADAVGYSKPGLLHRFGSKEALYRAVLAEVSDTVRDVVELAEQHAGSQEQLARVMERITRRALDRPGMVRMMLRAFDPNAQDPGLEDIQGSAYRLVDALDRPMSTPAERLRIVLGIELIVTAAMTQHSRVDTDLHVPTSELVPLLVSLATHVVAGPVTAMSPALDVTSRRA
jgi:AcrR family transcriptional regulator